METNALSGSSKILTVTKTINGFDGQSSIPSKNQTPEVKMHIGICDWCKEWGDLVLTRNHWGDKISVCKLCLDRSSTKNDPYGGGA